MKKIFGHRDLCKTLLGLSGSSRRHHGFIFSGPRGVGKFAVATEFGKHILKTGDEKHPDLHVIKKEDSFWSSSVGLQKKKQTNIPIDLLREKMIGGSTSDGKKHEALVFKTPRGGGEKVFIIDEAELLDQVGQNSLLKTLEEPPTNTTVILVTCREDFLLPTIHSRCHEYCFGPLTKKEFSSWVETQRGLNPEHVEWLTGLSGGSPGVFLEASHSNLFDLYQSIKPCLYHQKNVVSNTVGLVVDFLNRYTDGVVEKNKNASKESANNRGFELVCRVFGLRVSGLLKGEDVDLGVVLADIVSDVENQRLGNVSTPVLVESLVARWGAI